MINKIKGLLLSLKKHWRVAPEGRYMTFKEIASLSFGGIGIKFIVYCITNMIIVVGNTLIGNTIGIEPRPLYVIYILSVLSGFPLTALRAKMIDNTRSMKGKYRPYILSMGIPSVILGIGFIWAPYEHMTSFWKCAVVLAFNVGFQFFYNFMTDSYDSLINVLSPNTIERSDVSAVKSVVENFSPSIASIFLPIVAKLITGQNTLYDLKIYRIVYPPMLIVGFLISLLVYVNTEEKIVQAKTHVIQISFVDAFKAIAQNKYFWIISLAGWLGFLEGSFNSILGWMYNYQSACSAAQYSLIVAIAGNASFWPNLVAPFFIRKYGKKTILVFTNILNIGFILLMLPIVRMTHSGGIIWFLLICTFVNQFITSLGHFLNPSIQADIRDYQQYKTGERIDGMFAAVGLIGNVITLATSSVLPFIYEKAGLNKSVALSLGYDGSNVYDVLYNHDYFVQICSVLVIASVVGATLNVLPFFFYDLSENKQRAMVSVLKIRALFEDYGNNVLTDEALVEAVDIINEAKEYAQRETVVPNKDDIKKAKKQGKEQGKKAKQAYKTQLLDNEKIEVAKFVMAELNRFSTDEGNTDLELAKNMYEAGLDGFGNVFSITKAQAKAMPKDTPAQKERRKNTLRSISAIKTSKKAVKKYFPNGIVEFDNSIFEELFKAEDEIEVLLQATLKQVKSAKEAGDKAEASRLSNTVKEIQKQKHSIQVNIKKATEDNTLFYRAAKPYLDAKKLILQSENYARLEDIEALYDDAKLRISQKELATA